MRRAPGAATGPEGGSANQIRSLSCKTALGEEGFFRGARVAAENRVAMREPPESSDDYPVEQRIFQVFRVAEFVDECNRAVLVRKRFGMLVGQVEETP